MAVAFALTVTLIRIAGADLIGFAGKQASEY